MKYCFDVETDGFLNQCTKIHCIVLKNIDTNEILKLDNENAIKELEKADLIVGHNIIRKVVVSYNTANLTKLLQSQN